MKLENVYVREHNEKDIPFIYKSWLVNFRDSNNLEALIDKQIYFDSHKKIIDKILEQSTCLIAANPDDEDQIFGYVIFDNYKKLQILHYVYVKAPYRRLGIASLLKKLAFKLPHAIVTSHHTRMSMVLRDKWNLVFNPYILLDL